MDLLRSNRNCTAKAFNTVSYLIGKIMVVSFLLISDNHYVSLKSASISENSKSNCMSGKRESAAAEAIHGKCERYDHRRR